VFGDRHFFIFYAPWLDEPAEEGNVVRFSVESRRRW
jgi:hypothetical protein